jgi:hypothetical protein
MPENEGSKPTPVPTYNYNLDGQIVNLAEGLSANEIAQITEELADDPRMQEGAENAALENEQAVIPPTAEKEGEPEKPPAPEKEEPPKPEALKFKIKRFGQEIDLDLTEDQERLRTLVQCGYDYDERRKELDREKSFVRASKQVLESERFKEFLAGEQSEGRFLPEPTPPVNPTGLTEYAIRKLDPDFDTVRERMAVLAIELGDEIHTVVNSDHTAFVRLYDRVATDVRKKSATPTPPTKPAAEKVTEKNLKVKEVMKEKAVVVTPGSAPLEAPSEEDRWRKRDAMLAKRYKDSRSDDDAIALVQHRNYMPR